MAAVGGGGAPPPPPGGNLPNPHEVEDFQAGEVDPDEMSEIILFGYMARHMASNRNHTYMENYLLSERVTPENLLSWERYFIGLHNPSSPLTDRNVRNPSHTDSLYEFMTIEEVRRRQQINRNRARSQFAHPSPFIGNRRTSPTMVRLEVRRAMSFMNAELTGEESERPTTSGFQDAPRKPGRPVRKTRLTQLTSKKDLRRKSTSTTGLISKSIRREQKRKEDEEKKRGRKE
jgi:hypothetical protein